MKTEVTTRYDGSEVDENYERISLCGATAVLGDTIRDGEPMNQTM